MQPLRVGFAPFVLFLLIARSAANTVLIPVGGGGGGGGYNQVGGGGDDGQVIIGGFFSATECLERGGSFALGSTRCYYIPAGSSPETWSNAAQACTDDGATLASVHTAEEVDVIAQLWVNSGTNNNRAVGGGLWLGLNDRDVEGTYVWQDGSNQDYPSELPWADVHGNQQPNNFGPDPGQDCVAYGFISSGEPDDEWRELGPVSGLVDNNCDGTPQPFVCQVLLQPLVPSDPGYENAASLPCATGFDRRAAVVVVRQMEEQHLSIADLQIYGSADPTVNVAGAATCYQVPARGMYYDGSANGEMPQINDGDINTFSHSGDPVAAGIFAYCVLPALMEIDRLVVSPRQDWYDRSMHFRLELFRGVEVENGADLSPYRPVDKVWEADVQNSNSQWANHTVAVEGVDCRDTNECDDAENNSCDPDGAVCTNNAGSFTCQCTPGYLGNGTNCIDVDECGTGAHDCDANAACTNNAGSFTCQCTPGYLGNGTNCADVDECGTGTHDCDANAACSNSDGSFHCACLAGYSDLATGSQIRPVSRNCYEITDCLECSQAQDPRPAYAGDCVPLQPGQGNGNLCEPRIFAVDNGLILNTECAPRACLDMDECERGEHNCSSDAVCQNTMGSFECACNQGYEDFSGDGTVCSFDYCAADPQPCDDSSICQNTLGSFECPCKPGFDEGSQNMFFFNFDGGEDLSDWSQTPIESLSGGGFLGRFADQNNEVTLRLDALGTDHSELIVEFDFLRLDSWDNEAFRVLVDNQIVFMNTFTFSSNPCATTTISPGVFGGWTDSVYHFRISMSHSSNIADIRFAGGINQDVDDESWGIDNVRVITHGAQAPEYVGAYQVLGSCESCSDNIQNQDETGTDSGGVCDIGYDRNYCFAFDECSRATDNCHPNATCTDTHGSFSCTCTAGLVDWNGDGTVCDEDQCSLGAHNCHSSASCEDRAEGFECSCDPGYALNTVNGLWACQDVNECSEQTHNCAERADCDNSEGSFNCRCFPSTTDFNSDGTVCDLDECAAGSHNCNADATCSNSLGGFTCACNAGFSGDGVNNCTDVDECAAGSHTCDENTRCSNERGSYSCSCLTGFAPYSALCDARDGSQALGSEKCFFINKQPASWADAASQCNALAPNATLASVTSAAENKLLFDLYWREGADMISVDGRMWIGLNDRVEEGRFQWSDGSSFSPAPYAFDDVYHLIATVSPYPEVEPSAGTTTAGSAGTTTAEEPSETPAPGPQRPPDEGNVGIRRKLLQSSATSLPGTPGADSRIWITDSADGGYTVFFYLTNLAPEETSGGVHVHQGVSCESHAQVLGHHYNTSRDPWGAIAWTKPVGSTVATGFKKVLNPGFALAANDGRVVVVHSQSGSRIGCGILNQVQTSHNQTSPLDVLSVAQNIAAHYERNAFNHWTVGQPNDFQMRQDCAVMWSRDARNLPCSPEVALSCHVEAVCQDNMCVCPEGSIGDGILRQHGGSGCNRTSWALQMKLDLGRSGLPELTESGDRLKNWEEDRSDFSNLLFLNSSEKPAWFDSAMAHSVHDLRFLTVHALFETEAEASSALQALVFHVNTTLEGRAPVVFGTNDSIVTHQPNVTTYVSARSDAEVWCSQWCYSAAHCQERGSDGMCVCPEGSVGDGILKQHGGSECQFESWTLSIFLDLGQNGVPELTESGDRLLHWEEDRAQFSDLLFLNETEKPSWFDTSMYHRVQSGRFATFYPLFFTASQAELAFEAFRINTFGGPPPTVFRTNESNLLDFPAVTPFVSGNWKDEDCADEYPFACSAPADKSICTDIDECLQGLDNCDANAACNNTIGSFVCRCNDGHFGDGLQCPDVNECVHGLDNCDANAACNNTIGSFVCECNDGYFGDGLQCSDVNECVQGLDNCDANAACNNTIGSFVCECNDGYFGDGLQCSDVNECVQGTHDCTDSAVCTNNNGSFTCACGEGFTASCPGYTFPSHSLTNGAHWETASSAGCDSCESTQVIDFDGVDDYVDLGILQFPGGDVSYSARIMAVAANRWSRVFDLGDGQGQNNQLLAFEGTSGRLTFHSYDGTSSASNAPIAPTALQLNRWHHVAVTVHGSTASLYLNGALIDTGNAFGVRTALSSNYLGRSNWADEYFQGQIADFRAFGRALTASEIADLSNGMFATGLDLLPLFNCSVSPNPVCGDADECSLQAHDCHSDATCHNSAGSFTCGCNVGFVGDGMNCTDLDECFNVTHCHPDATCANSVGSFACVCDVGFSGDGVSCNDINECTLGNDDCHVHAMCTNTEGSFTCACNSGFIGDGLACEDVDECAAPMAPVFGISTSTTLTNAAGATDGQIDLGDWQTYSAYTHYIADCDSVAHVVVDLGSPPIYISGVTVYHYYGDVRQYCSQSVELSVTGEFAGEEVEVFSCGTFAECGDVSDTGRQVTFAPTQARYLRVGSSRNNRNNGVHILEVEHTPSTACSPNATCNNTVGGVSCSCNFGYSGDGATCEKNDCITADGTTTCYKDLDRTSTFASAVALCEAEGGHLPVVRSLAESEFIYSLTGQQTWLGLTRGQATSPDISDYMWVTGLPAQPVPNVSIAINDGALGSDCLRIVESSLWGDDCGGQYAVVCQMATRCATGYRSSGDTCVDQDECMLGTDNCDASLASCTNTPGSFTCSCLSGWESIDGGVNCTDIVECGQTDNCDANAICTDGNGSFTCTCANGTIDWNADGTFCDVDECESDELNLCDSNATCINTAGSFECQCNDWYAVPDTVTVQFDFEGDEDLSAWSQITLGSTSATTFLGQFDANNTNVSLTLAKLLPHTELILEFDFYRFDDWHSGESFSIDVDGQNVFRNSYRSGSNDTCAVASGGDFFFGAVDDAIYHYRISVPHAAGSAVISFYGDLNQTKDHASWGIDDVNVTVHSAGSENYVGAFTIEGSCETCDDGIQNQNEDGVDSGGVCDPPASMHAERRYCFPLTKCVRPVHNVSCVDLTGRTVSTCPILDLCWAEHEYAYV